MTKNREPPNKKELAAEGTGGEIMRVYELIELLEKCPNKGAFVMYDATEGIRNNALTVYDDMGEEQREPHFSVDDVLVGSGTIRGYVYLTEEQEAR